MSPLRHCIDPNDAPWWELATLPRLGPTLARAIVDQRRVMRETGPNALDKEAAAQTPRFQTAADLMVIRGIGPKTVARLSPYLCFADSP